MADWAIDIAIGLIYELALVLFLFWTRYEGRRRPETDGDTLVLKRSSTMRGFMLLMVLVGTAGVSWIVWMAWTDPVEQSRVGILVFALSVMSVFGWLAVEFHLYRVVIGPESVRILGVFSTRQVEYRDVRSIDEHDGAIFIRLINGQSIAIPKDVAGWQAGGVALRRHLAAARDQQIISSSTSASHPASR